jgi:hypothetical protein
MLQAVRQVHVSKADAMCAAVDAKKKIAWCPRKYLPLRRSVVLVIVIVRRCGGWWALGCVSRGAHASYARSA